jgi:predicted DNA-binding transcriptional regulator AlpA
MVHLVKKPRGRPARKSPDTRTSFERYAALKSVRHERAVIGISTFNSLPNVARVRQPVVEALFSISATTVWRRVKAGQLPAPSLNGRIASWSAGEIRAALEKIEGAPSHV